MRSVFVFLSLLFTLPLAAQPIFQVGAAAVFPISKTFRDAWHSGSGLHASVAHPVWRSLHLTMDAFGSHFMLDHQYLRDQAGLDLRIEGGEAKIYSGSLGLRYFNPARKIVPYAEVSGGLYFSRLNSITASFRGMRVTEEGAREYRPGAAAGVGISLPLSRLLRLAVGQYFVIIFDNNGKRNFAPLKASLIIL